MMFYYGNGRDYIQAGGNPNPVERTRTYPYNVFTLHTVCVCDLVFDIALHAARRAMAAAVAVYMYDLFPGTSTGLAGHSRAPNHQQERQRENTRKKPSLSSPEKVCRRTKERTEGKYILGRPWPALLSICLLPPSHLFCQHTM